MQFAYADNVIVTASSKFKDFSGTDFTDVKSVIKLVCCGKTDRLLVPLLEQSMFHFRFAAVILENTTTVNVVRFEIKFFSARIFRCMNYAIKVPVARQPMLPSPYMFCVHYDLYSSKECRHSNRGCRPKTRSDCRRCPV